MLSLCQSENNMFLLLALPALFCKIYGILKFAFLYSVSWARRLSVSVRIFVSITTSKDNRQVLKIKLYFTVLLLYKGS